jgi:DNA repair exonuclease SbcCD ATPase subunit/predicted MPP superfamily phosphohydrolase
MSNSDFEIERIISDVYDDVSNNTVLTSSSNKKINKIYHLADIHIRLHTKRHIEYKHVFENLYKILESDNDPDSSIIVICGDILHSKTELSPECIDMTIDFLKKLSSIMDTFIIMGNHDGNLSNRDTLDSLTPIMREITPTKQLHYLKYSGAYEYRNIVFGVSSIIDEDIFMATNLNNDNKLKIALAHRAVDGSKSDLGYTVKNEKVLPEYFNGYDLTLLGSVHKYQYINKSNTMCYPSTLIQQGYGEHSTNHGLIKWTINRSLNSKKPVTSFKSEFIIIPNEYGYRTIKVKKGKIIGNVKIPPKPRLRFILEDTNQTQYNEMCKKYKSDYDVQEITFSNVYSDYDKKDSLSHNINDMSNQNKLIMKYAKNKFELDVEELKVLKELNSELNKEIKKDTREITNKWKLKELQFSNMFCYGKDNVIDFQDLNGIIGLLSPNNHGKSSILDIVLFTLFDKCSRGLRTDIINSRKKNFHCQIMIEINGIDYVVMRIGKKDNHDKLRVDAHVWIIEGETEKSLNGKDRHATNKVICNLIGSYEDYIMTSFCLQKDINFIDYPQAKKKDFLMKLLRLDIFESLLKKCKDKFKVTTQVYKKLYSELEDINVEELKKEHINLISDKERLEIQHEKVNICNEEIYDKIHQLTTKLYYIDDEVLSIDLDKINSEHEELCYERDNLHEKLKSTRKKLESKIKKEKSYSKQLCEYNIDEIIEEKATFENSNKRKLNDLNEQQKELYEKKQPIKKVKKSSKFYKKKLKCLKEELENLEEENVKLKEINHSLNETSFDSKHFKVIKNKHKKYINLEKDLDEVEYEKNDIDNKIAQLKITVEKLEAHEYDPNCKFCVNNQFVKDAMKVNSELKDLINENNGLCGKHKSINKKINKLKADEKKYHEMINEKKKYDDSKKQLENMKDKLELLCLKLDTCQEKINKTNDLLSTISQNKKNEKKNNQIDENINDINNQIDEINLEEFETYDEYMYIKEQYDKLCLLIKNLEVKTLKIESEENKISEQIKEKDRILKENAKYQKVIETNRETIQKITDHKIQISMNKSKMMNINKNIPILSSDISKLNSEIKSYSKKLDELNDYELHKKIQSTYIKIVDKNGLPYTLLDNVIPKIQTKVNEILSLITNFTINIELQDNNFIDIRKNLNNQENSIDICCSSEKFFTGCAIRIALTQLTNLSSCNFLVIDEGFSCLDPDNRNNIDGLFAYLKKEFDFVLIISHLSDMKARCDNILTIKKNKYGYSKISYKN